MDDKQLNSWIDGDLPPDQAARFERDNALDSARAWLSADPPGLARADRLPIPQLAVHSGLRTPHSAFRTWRWLLQPALAAALFIGGFYIGRIGQIGPIETTSPTRAVPAVAVKATPTPAPRRSGDQPTQLAKAEPPTRYVTRQDGRVIIETTLADSGAHATWVIDGSFKLASNEPKSN